MQIKPQTVEAVLFFNDGGVCKEMLYPEFEAMLDGVVSMLEFADQQMRVAYVLVNARLQIRAAVFFYLDFNEDGSADSGWNIPLRSLAERTGRGPDLGAGPIRLHHRPCPPSVCKWWLKTLGTRRMRPSRLPLAVPSSSKRNSGSRLRS